MTLIFTYSGPIDVE